MFQTTAYCRNHYPSVLRLGWRHYFCLLLLLLLVFMLIAHMHSCSLAGAKTTMCDWLAEVVKMLLSLIMLLKWPVLKLGRASPINPPLSFLLQTCRMPVTSHETKPKLRSLIIVSYHNHVTFFWLQLLLAVFSSKGFGFGQEWMYLWNALWKAS